MKNLDPKITRYIFDKYVFLDKVDSTNEYCKSPLVRGDRIVRAAKQTKGRGRMGRCFSSEDGGFYISDCFCGELGSIAGSFLSLTGKRVDEDELLTELSVRIFGVYNCILNGDRERMNIIAEKYREHCITLGRTVHILRPELAPNGMDPKKLFSEEPNRFPSAIALDIDENFALIVRYPDGCEEKILSGEVSVAL